MYIELGNTSSKYLLVAEKPTSHDYCRGCHMATYNSDIIRESFDNQDELIERLAELENIDLGPSEAGYDFTLHISGEENPYDKRWEIQKLAETRSKEYAEEKSVLRIREQNAKRLEEEKEDKARRFEEYKELRSEFDTA